MNNRRINSKSSHEEAADVEAASCLVIPCHYLPRFPHSPTDGRKGYSKKWEDPFNLIADFSAYPF